MRGRLQWFIRVAVSLLVSVSQAGCFTAELIRAKAEGEPIDRLDFTVTTRGEEYELLRASEWMPSSGATLQLVNIKSTFPVPRKALPPACGGIARFFVNGPEQPMAIGAWTAADPLTADRAPHPDDRYPPCTVLVAYGTFADTVPTGGVVATLPEAVVAIHALRRGHPLLYALLPAAIVVDFYLFIAASPVALASVIPFAVGNSVKDRRARAAREKQEAELPPSVASCWSAAKSGIKDGTLPAPAERFESFTWDPDVANAYTRDRTPGTFGPDEPIAIDERVVLDGARVGLRDVAQQGTDAQFVCGLSEGRIAATRLELRE